MSLSNVNQQLNKPTCLDFGPDRVSVWPGYFFCSNCVLHENELLLGNSKAKRSSKKCTCKGGHVSFNVPTTKVKKWCKAIVDNDVHSEDDDSDEDNNADSSNMIVEQCETSSNNLKNHTNNQKDNVKKQKNRAWALQKVNQDLKKKQFNLDESLNLSDKISHATRHVCTQAPCNRCGYKRMKIETSKAILDKDFLDGKANEELKLGFVTQCKKETCTARNVLKAMDLSSGSLNLSAIEELRSVEDLKHRERGFMPSNGQIRNIQNLLNKCGQNLVPCTSMPTESGECVTFEAKQMLKVTIMTCKLNDVGKNRSLIFAVTSDGAKITNNLHQVVAGFKMCDAGATDPSTNRLIKPQSRNACWPLRIVLGRENESMHANYINPTHAWWDDCDQLEANGKRLNHHFPDLQPFNLCYTNDMSAGWKLTKKGGCSKIKKFFCPCCDTTSSALHMPNSETCSNCEEVLAMFPEKRDKWICFCKKIMSKDSLDIATQEHDNFRSQISMDCDQIANDSKLQLTDNDMSEAKSSNASTDFIWSTESEKRSFMNLLFQEAMLRELHFIGKSIEELRFDLKEELIREKKLKELKVRLDHLTPAEGVNFLMLQMIPCILHMETRLGLKVLTLILQDGLSNAKGSLLPSTINVRSENKREEICKKKIEDMINNSILGSDCKKYQCELPLEPNPNGTGRRIGIINLENSKVRKIIENLHDIVHSSYVDECKKEDPKEAIDCYDVAFTVVRKNDEDYTAEELLSCKMNMNKFCSTMVQEHGRKIFTNYFHCVITNYLYDHMLEWKNLSRHSQQGWESLNALLKSFFFRRTSKGGGKTKSKMHPMAKLIQRRVMWMSGIADKILDAHEKDKNFNLQSLFPDSCVHAENEVENDVSDVENELTL